MSLKDLQQKLNKALKEIERLRKENTRLRSLIEDSREGSNDEVLEEESGLATLNEAATSEEKIKLFRDYFRGRDDVYAVRWTNRSGKSGYSPACYYEWDPTKCKKPYGKCEDCKYIPIDDEVIRRHLSGKHVIGIYPLLKNETCWFLAVDFDKSTWQKDAETFISTC